MAGIDTKALCERIRAYALEHYNEGGWDILVECWDDPDILRHCVLAVDIEYAYAYAINKLSEVLKQNDDYRRDIQAEAF